MLNKKGYTLVELIIVMAIFIIVIMVSSSAFERIVKNAGQLTKSVESQFEGVVGLNLMRYDVEHAGYGLPWSFQSPVAYPEVDVASSFLADGIDSNAFNDKNIPLAVDPGQIPKAIASGTSTTTGIDYLVVKSALASINGTGKKWSFVNYSVNAKTNTNLSYIKQWSKPDENFTNGENIITLANIPNQNAASLRTKELVTDGTKFYYPYAGSDPPEDLFKPVSQSQIFTIYGIDEKPLRMPFNRADFYVKRPSSNMPASCNAGTGILYKGVAVHTSGGFVQYPLVDCVGDMQVAFEIDKDHNGNITYYKDLSALSAEAIRDGLKRVRIYVLAHEGSRDRNYSYPVSDPSKAIVVGDPAFTVSFGRIWSSADLAAKFGPDWRNYRWKLYTLAIKPSNLN